MSIYIECSENTDSYFPTQDSLLTYYQIRVKAFEIFRNQQLIINGDNNNFNDDKIGWGNDKVNKNSNYNP